MAASVLVDTGFLLAVLNRRDANHRWAATLARDFVPVWHTCEAVISETFHLLGPRGASALAELLRRRTLLVAFELESHLSAVLTLIHKYSDVPMSFADACLVRMTEILSDPVLLSTDSDFRIYRRHSRQVVPCILPP